MSKITELNQAKEKQDELKGFEISNGKPALKLNDGSLVELDVTLNIKKLMLINRDFNTDAFVQSNIGSDESISYSIVQGIQAVYIAYRQAHMNEYLTYDEFYDQWDFDNEVAQRVYWALLYKKVRTDFQKSFEKSFKAKK